MVSILGHLVWPDEHVFSQVSGSVSDTGWREVGAEWGWRGSYPWDRYQGFSGV